MSTIQELDELISKSKEKKAVYNGRIPSIKELLVHLEMKKIILLK